MRTYAIKIQVFTLLVATCLFLCACHQDKSADYLGKWYQVQQRGEDFYIIECDDDSETISAQTDSLFYHGLMEDLNVAIHSSNTENDVTTVKIHDSEQYFIKFSWVDREKGISKWEMSFAQDPTVVKYFVAERHRKGMRKIDCDVPQQAAVGEHSSADTMSRNHSQGIAVKNNNCIHISDTGSKVDFEKCYAVDFIEIRSTAHQTFALTFISGKSALEADFVYNGNDWIAEKATYFDGTTARARGTTKVFHVSLRDFDFEEVRSKVVQSKN